MRTLLIIALLAALAGCGGGDPETADQTTIPARCGDNPKACT